MAGALAVPGGIPAHAAPAALECPSSAALLTGLRADPLTDEAAGNPAVLESVSCALPWATAVVPEEGEYDAAFVLFRYDEAAQRWKPLNVGSGAVCDESVPGTIAAQLEGCQLNDGSGDELPDEEPVEDPEEPALEPDQGAKSALAASQVGGPITRDEIMRRAQGWVDNQPGPYSQRAFSWDPTHTRKYRRDCSGLVGMAWHLNADPSTRTLHQYSDQINKSDLRPGDILNSAGKHVVLFKSWKGDGRHFTYYTFGATPVKIRTAAIDSGTIDSHPRGNYLARRYKKIAALPKPPTPNPARPSVSGDARADLVVHGHDGRIELRVGTGGGFQNTGEITSGWGRWVTGADLGRLHFADVNGDGKKDLIENGTSGEINVRRGTGTSFGAPQQLTRGWGRWVTGHGDELGVLHFADVNGDGKADLIENGKSGEVNVRLGSGTSFGAPVQLTSGWGRWVTGADLGRLHFADINGDHKADLIENGRSGEINVRRGTGTSFGAPQQLTRGWGRWVTGEGNELGVLHFADVTGDGKADLIENGKSGEINVRRGTGTSFGAPDQLTTGWGRWVNGNDLGRLYFA